MRIDLHELGEGMHIVIKDPKRLSWKEQKEIIQAMGDGNDPAKQMESAEILAIALIKSGYVLDEDNHQIGFPLNKETVGRLPAVVVEKVLEAYAKEKKSTEN